MEDLQKTDRDFWMNRAIEESQKSTCIRQEFRIGAIAVFNNNLLAFGHNGAPGNIPPCETRGYCIRKHLKIPSGIQREVAYCICAEQHMICNAARDGIRLNGAEVYVTHKPCAVCVRLMIKCGVVRAFYKNEYPGHFTDELCEMSGFELVKL